MYKCKTVADNSNLLFFTKGAKTVRLKNRRTKQYLALIGWHYPVWVSGYNYEVSLREQSWELIRTNKKNVYALYNRKYDSYLKVYGLSVITVNSVGMEDEDKRLCLWQISPSSSDSKDVEIINFETRKDLASLYGLREEGNKPYPVAWGIKEVGRPVREYREVNPVCECRIL